MGKGRMSSIQHGRTNRRLLEDFGALCQFLCNISDYVPCLRWERWMQNNESPANSLWLRCLYQLMVKENFGEVTEG
jgi:hypothetical protein